jgi:hypothetical protein
MHKRLILVATLALAVVALAATSAFGGGGRLQLYLVNSGPSSSFYNDSLASDGSCGRIDLASSLSTHPGTGLRQDSVGYLPDVQGVSSLSYTVPAGSGFTIPVSTDAIVLKLWAFSGDGTCDGQNVNPQTIGWSLSCSGPTCGLVSLVSGPDSGYQDITIAANTPKNTLQNLHVGVSSPVTVGAGDTITLKFQSNTYAPIQWNASNGAGVSSLNILTR